MSFVIKDWKMSYQKAALYKIIWKLIMPPNVELKE